MQVDKLSTIRHPEVAAAAFDEDSSWQPPRKVRWGLWMGIAGVLVVAALLISYQMWARSTRKELKATLDQLRAAGEPVDPSDLTRPPIPAADNAAFDLRAAALLIDTTTPAWKAYQAVSFEQPLGDEAKAAVANVLQPESTKPALARVRVARSKKGADWQTRVSSPLISMMMPDIQTQRAVADLCRAAAMEALLRRDYAEAVEYARDTLGIARAAETQPGLVGHLVGNGMLAMAAYQVEQAAHEIRIGPGDLKQGGAPGEPGATAATPGQVQALIAELLDEAAFRQGLLRGLRDERVMEINTALAIADGKLRLADVAGGSGGGGPFGGVPMVPTPMILADAKLMVDYVTAVTKVVEKSPDYPTYRLNAPPSPLPPPNAPNQGRHVMAHLLLPAFDRAIQAHYRVLAERRMAATALALRWYQADHNGQAPKALEELVPKYLPAVPKDPFAPAVQPLRYLADENGLGLYSVGEDGQDNGGSEVPINLRRKTTARWEQRDAVFWLKKPPADAADGAKQ